MSISEHTTNKGHLTKRSVSMESTHRENKHRKDSDRIAGASALRYAGRQNVFQSNQTDVWHSILGVPPAGIYLPDSTLLWNLISWRSQLMV